MSALTNLANGFPFSGNPQIDAPAFLYHHECPNTAAHSQKVAETAFLLAVKYGMDQQQAETAGWLHDISAVVPNDERLAFSQKLGLEILPEEAEVPLLLHQKISAEIARELFNIQDQTILNAICCHTTLKSQPTPMETLLFVADKLAWDQKGTPPFFQAMTEALEHSLEKAAWVYQDYLLHSGKLKIAHPWMFASHQELAQQFGHPE